MGHKYVGYDFKIICKKGKKFFFADVLSRKDEDVDALLYDIYNIQSEWIIEERDEWTNDEEVWTPIQNLQQDPSTSETFS